ncbi:hypothetical protein WN943_012765 [Citrus x changshan-huyou]
METGGATSSTGYLTVFLENASFQKRAWPLTGRATSRGSKDESNGTRDSIFYRSWG